MDIASHQYTELVEAGSPMSAQQTDSRMNVFLFLQLITVATEEQALLHNNQGE